MSENRIGESSSESSISSSSGGGGLYNLHGNALTLTLLGIVVFILVLLSFHYKHRLQRGRGRARSQFVVAENSGAAGTEVPPSPPSKGLHDSTLQALPVFPFDPEWAQREGGLRSGGRGGSWAKYLQQCAVCLSPFEGGDEVRLLPRCMHAFHAACIDLWFRSHSDCPLCRQRVHDDGEGGNNDSGSGTGGNTVAAAEVVVCIGGSCGSASASTTANNNVTSTTAPHTWLKVATCEEDHGTGPQ